MKTITALLFTTLLISCQSKKEVVVKNINNTAKIYITAILGEYYHLDEIKPIHIDTITPKACLFLQSSLILAEGDSLCKQISIESDLMKDFANLFELSHRQDNVSRSEAKRCYDKINIITIEWGRLIKINDSILIEAGHADSVTFLYYNAIYKIKYTDKKLCQKERDIELIITPDFKVKEKQELINYTRSL